MKKVFIFVLMWFCATANAAPKPELWEFWDEHGTDSGTVSHQAWSEFLSQYISMEDGVALLDYGGVSDADKSSLDDYVDMLGQTKARSLSKEEQLAYWINLYNSLTVKTVLENYPVPSIRNISSGFLPTGPWDDKLITVEGEELSLNDIEHRILRPIWKDARLHYAVNCASIGCPNLADTAYTAENTESLLESGANAYVNHSRGVEVQNGKLYVSSIYEWFAEDFGSNDAEIIEHLKQYAGDELTAELDNISSIADDDYDWSLNDK